MDDFEGSMRLWGFADVEARGCKAAVCRIIQEGGSAQYCDGTNSYVLDAGRAIQPLIHTLPAPGLLGLLQPLLRAVAPKYIQLEIYAGHEFQPGRDKPIWEHLYKSSEMATAVEQFLQRTSPATPLRLWRAR